MTGTILIVEDDPSLALTETIWLEREGYAVIHVAGGEEAIETVLADDGKIELVLMDIELKGELNGVEAAKKILSCKDIPVIFLSSHSDKSIIKETEKVSPYGYIIKDTMELVLSTSVKTAIQIYRLRLELKEKSEELEQSGRQFNELMNQANICYYTEDLITGNIKPFGEMLSCSVKEKFAFQTREEWSVLIHPDYRQAVRDKWLQAVLNKAEFNLEYKIILPENNTELWVGETGKVFTDSAGRAFIIKGMLHDITAEKEKYEKPIAAEDLYSILLDDSSDPIFAIDEESVYLYVNKAFASGVNKNQADIIGRKISDVFSKKEAEIRFSALKEVIKTGIPKVIEVKVDALGPAHYYMTTIQPLQARYGNKKAVMCISKNITERREAEISLAKKDEQYRDLFMKSPGALLLEDMEGNIINLNPAFSRMTGYTQAELTGKNVNIFVPREDLDRLEDDLSTLKSKHAYDHIVRNIKKNGEPYWVDLRESVLTLPDGKEGILVLANDITDKKNAEIQLEKYAEELEISNATKNKFFSIISHDLRGPFMAFLGLSKMLAQDEGKLTREKIRKISSTLYTSLQQQYEMLTDLLDWSRLQSNNIALEREKLNVFKEVDCVIESLALNASVKGIEIFNAVEPGTHIYADPNMFKLIMRNLLSNSIKFTTNGGLITISSFTKNSLTEITVADNGVGIDEENIRKLFKIDSRFSTDGTAKERGTGLGLILCKEIIDRHEGKIKVISQKNKGSKFSVILPSEKNN